MQLKYTFLDHVFIAPDLSVQLGVSFGPCLSFLSSSSSISASGKVTEILELSSVIGLGFSYLFVCRAFSKCFCSILRDMIPLTSKGLSLFSIQ